MSRDLGFGKPAHRQQRYIYVFWSLQAKRPQLSQDALAAWTWCRVDNSQPMKYQTATEKLADRRYNPFNGELA